MIKSWDQGMTGMKVGGKHTLIIPSQLGYGQRGADGVLAGYSEYMLLSDSLVFTHTEVL